MNCASSLTQLIKSTFNITSKSKFFKPLFNATLEYVLGYVNEKSYHLRLAEIGVKFPENLTYKGFRLIIREQSSIMVNIKYYTAYLLLARGNKFTKEHAEEIYKSYSLHMSDAVCCWRFAKKFKRVSRVKNKLFKDLKIEQVSPKGLAAYHRNLSSMVEQLMKYCRQRAYKKLRFLYQNSNETQDAMVAELMAGGVRAYMGMSPQIVSQEREHQLNRIRTSINNWTTNYIQAETKQSKARLVNVGKDNKEKAVFVLMEQNFSGYNEDGEGNSVYTNVEDPNTRSTALVDLDLAVNRLIDKHKGTRRAELLRVMFDRSCTRFIKFLRKSQRLEVVVKDTQDIISTLGRKKFFDSLSTYLKVSKETILSYLDRLKTDLNINGVIHA